MQELGKGQYSGKVTAIHDGQGVISSITAYERDNFNNTLHYHENTHISLVVAGGCGERKRDHYDRLPGMLTFYYAGEPHQVMQVKKASRHINLEIEQKFLDQYQFNEIGIASSVTERPDGKFLLFKMYKEMLAVDAASELSISMLLLDFLSSTGKMSSAQPHWISIIHELLRDRWAGQVSLDELSVASGVHPVTVCKYFHKYFGCTLAEYMRKLKIERALPLMGAAGLNLTQIAYTCGFADQKLAILRAHLKNSAAFCRKNTWAWQKQG